MVGEKLKGGEKIFNVRKQRKEKIGYRYEIK